MHKEITIDGVTYDIFPKQTMPMSISNKVVRLKDGTLASVTNEWNWQDNPCLKIMEEDRTTRIYDDFVDVELPACRKGPGETWRYGLPRDSAFHKVIMTVLRRDVEFVNLMVD
jgi:hypothetical protein